jgi:hypothetical protein
MPLYVPICFLCPEQGGKLTYLLLSLFLSIRRRLILYRIIFFAVSENYKQLSPTHIKKDVQIRIGISYGGFRGSQLHWN